MSFLEALLRFLKREILYNGHLQSLGTATIVYGTGKLLNIEPIVPATIASYFLFQSIYIYDRYHDLKIDLATNAVRSKHLLSYAPYIPIIFLLYLFATSLFLIKYSNITALIYSFILLILGILYPIYFKRLTKTIPLFKNIYVASVFAISTLYPGIFTATRLQSIDFITLISLYIFIEALIMQFILDCKDTETDKEEGLKTLPVLTSKTRAIQIIYSIICIKALIYLSLIFADLSHLSGELMTLVILTTGLNLYATYLVQHDKFAGYLLSSGKFLTWAPIVLLVHKS